MTHDVYHINQEPQFLAELLTPDESRKALARGSKKRYSCCQKSLPELGGEQLAKFAGETMSSLTDRMNVLFVVVDDLRPELGC